MYKEEVTYLVKKHDETVAIVHENEIFTRLAKAQLQPRLPLVVEPKAVQGELL